MEQTSEARELREYLSVLGRRKKLIAVVTLACGLLALGASLLQSPTYRATTEVLFESGTARLAVDPSAQRAGDPVRLLQNEVQFLESERVSELAEAKTGLSGSVTVAVAQPSGDIMFVASEAGDAADAAAIANSHAEAYIEERREQGVQDYADTIEVVQANLDEVERAQAESALRIAEISAELAAPTAGTDVSALTAERNSLQADQGSVFDEEIRLSARLRDLELGRDLAETEVATITKPATPPGAPTSPKPVRNTAAGLVAGLVVGIGAAFIRDYLDDAIKTKDRLEMALGRRAPTLALIPSIEPGRGTAATTLVTVDDLSSPATEGYRSLRTSLALVQLDAAPRVILVTSAEANEGKTTLAANLAAAIAQTDRRVMTIDGDLRRSRLHELFGLASAPGLTRAVQNGSLNGVVQEFPALPQLHLLAAGTLPPDPTEILAADELDAFVNQIRARYDYIVIDCPPVLPVADALSLSRVCDAIVLVADAQVTSVRSLRRAVEAIEAADAPLIGTVLNRADTVDDYYTSYRAAGADEVEELEEAVSFEGEPGDARDAEPEGDGVEHDASDAATTGIADQVLEGDSGSAPQVDVAN